MSVLTGRRIIGAFSMLIIIWLIPVVAHAAVPTVAISAPDSVTAGSSSPVYVLVQDSGVPLAGASVTASVLGPGLITPGTAVSNGSGYATFTLAAPTTAGTVTLSVSCGGATATDSVQVRSGPPVTGAFFTPAGLLPADGYCVYNFKGRFTDQYGNGCAGWPVNITLDGVNLFTVSAGPDGNYSFNIGPRSSSHTYAITVEANGLTGSTWARFLDVNLYLFGYPSSVPAGQNVSITAMLLDDTTPAMGILLTFTVYSPGDLASPSTFAGYTDATGKVVFTFQTSPTAGMNTVIIGNQSLGGDLRYASIRGTGGLVSQIILATTPSPVLADDTTHCILRIWAKDSGGNPVKNEELTVIRNYIENYTVTTNTNGYAEIDVGTSPYVGSVHFDVVAENNVSNGILASYVAGPPAMTVIKAVPNVIASSDVPQPPGMTDVHLTDVIAQVTDQWYHPLPGYDITVSSMNTSAGTIVGNTSGTTDANGEFYTQFRLGNFCNGTGTVDVLAVSGTLSSTYPITYTNNSFLSVDTSMAPRNVSINGTINVQVSIKGVGWNNRPQPVDMMLITDRSGSMDWYSNYLYPSNGIPQNGTMAIEDKEYLIATYYNPGHTALQFMLSSPYTNYANNSYYYGLKVQGPGGNKTGTRSSNENYYIYTNAQVGTYKVYAKATYTAAGGTPPYSFAVLTRPKRLGSAGLDSDSAAKQAAVQLANNMTYLDQMGLVSFNTAATLNAPLKVINGTNKTNLLNAISNLDADGGTSPYTGIQRARQEYTAHGRSNAKHVAILLSDGYSQSPANDIAQAYAAKADGIIIFTIGMGMADNATLETIAHITGGEYYRATSSMELADRYQQIFKNVTDVVAKDSVMDIIATRSLVNGTLMNDTQYVPNTSIVTFTNGTTAFIEPEITYDIANYTLSWEPGSINCNQVWSVSYQLKAMHGGLITPIANTSQVRSTRPDGSTETVYFVADTLFCRGTLDGHIGMASPGLQINITTPVSGTITDQLRLLIGWQVSYNWTETYTQRVSILPVDEYEWKDIARGFAGDRNDSGAYTFWWNLERVPTGNYTVQVFVTDGTYDAQDEVTISIPYRSGKIVLQ